MKTFPTRRKVLSALGLLAGASAGSARAAQPRKVFSRARLSLVLRFSDGSSLTFTQAAAKHAGDYVGQFVHQKCFVVRKGDWTVFFRPDADGAREEIVVERGRLRLGPGEQPSHILEPYTATILENGQQIAQITVPQHWWLARWRWQSAPRPIRRSLQDLIAMKAICPFDKTALWGAQPLQTAIEWQGPMSTGGLATAMGEAGERPDIGPITDYQAGYLIDGNSAALTTMMAQAEAVGSFPAYARDERTGALVDVYRVPDVAFSGGGVTIPTPPAPTQPNGAVVDNFFVLNAAHMPSPSYVPWLLTDDPYFYEGMEVVGSYGILVTDYHRSLQHLPGLTYPGETRAWGWGVREPLRLAAFAPEKPPSWLKPRKYWQRIVADNLAFTRQYVESPASIHQIFHQFTRADFFQPWENGYVMSSLGWAVWSGFFPEWAEFTNWFAGSLLPLSDGSSGWDRRWPAPYNVQLLGARTGQINIPAMLAVTDNSWDASTPGSWSEAWTLFPVTLATQGSNDYSPAPQPLDPRLWQDPTRVYENGIDSPYGAVKGAPSGPDYCDVIRCALAYMVLAGVPGARVAHDWLYAQMPMICASYNATGYHKWSVAA